MQRVFRFNTCDISAVLQRHLSEKVKLEQIPLRIKCMVREWKRSLSLPIGEKQG